ncbi:MAG: metallophosphoesterase [Kofleriaceae bacterium]
MQRTLIIGDIHGCYDELLQLLDVAAVTSDDIVVSVGDLVDRGPQPGEVVRWFRARRGAVVLMGNHERKHVRKTFSYSQEVTRLQLGESYSADVEWMRGLPYYYETPAIRVVHAAMMPGVPLAEQAEDVLAGTVSGETKLRAAIPDAWWHERYTDDVPIAFGHHVVPEPLLRDGKIYGLDTGACHGGRLTALSVPDFTLHSVPARADHWAATARAYQVPVLRQRAWPTLSWRKIHEVIGDREGAAGPDTTAYLAALTAWVAAVHGLIPAVFAAIPAIAERVGSAGFEAHPAKPLLYLHARNRLALADVESRCPTPAATLALATKLGIATAEIPAPP